MTQARTSRPDYHKRLRRVEKLVARFSFAREILEFYRRIATFQQELYTKIPAQWGRDSVIEPDKPLRAALNLVALLPHFPGFLSLVEHDAPVPLAAAAQAVASKSSAAWTASLADYWEQGGRDTRPADPKEQFLSRAFLQPYAEFAAERIAIPPLFGISRVCPLCEAWPMLGVLRPEGDGGKRFLVCSFCAHEWEFRRVLCPACTEEDEKMLPVYVAEEFPHIRVEACETCKFSLRTIDLTKDGNAVPIVDDLAAIPLSLWAEEHGYKRLQPNLLGS